MVNETDIDVLVPGELADLFAATRRAPGQALPAERAARIAARRAFVTMKQLFLRAVQDLGHRKGEWLREQVRNANDPVDLWLIRGPLLGALRENEPATRQLRGELYKSLDCTFPDAFDLPEVTLLSSPAGAWRSPPPGARHGELR